MGIKLTGEWDTVRRCLTEKLSTFDKVGDKPMRECAELYLKKLKSNIETQKLDWAPLNAKYLAMKQAKGLDTRTLIATGNYLSQLKIGPMKSSGSKLKLNVGAMEKDIHEPSGLPMSAIATIFEYGSSDGRIPARPHFRATWEQVRPECRNIWLKAGRDFFRWR